jgi:catechol 2,3-dioxygenase-like lactoylglutathione lyase family enzyme
MIDHINVPVRDLDVAARFYTAALAPLGAAVIYQDGNTAGLGQPGKPCVWLAPNERVQPLHLAFVAGDQQAVRRFHAAALAAGATDNGPPGPRPDYGPDYFAAFVRDPDGHNLEAVCHAAA